MTKSSKFLPFVFLLAALALLLAGGAFYFWQPVPYETWTKKNGGQYRRNVKTREVEARLGDGWHSAEATDPERDHKDREPRSPRLLTRPRGMADATEESRTS